MDATSGFWARFDPAALQVPSPLWGLPANWLMPLLLWLGILRYTVYLVRSPQLTWLWLQLARAARATAAALSKGLTFPERHPMREMAADVGLCILDYLFSLYFLVYGMGLGFVGVYAMGQLPALKPLAAVGVGGFFLILARWYAVRGSKGRRSLHRQWRVLRAKGWKAYVALAGMPILLIAVSFGSQAVQSRMMDGEQHVTSSGAH